MAPGRKENSEPEPGDAEQQQITGNGKEHGGAPGAQCSRLYFRMA
jgi:hypothetical protein